MISDESCMFDFSTKEKYQDNSINESVEIVTMCVTGVGDML